MQIKALRTATRECEKTLRFARCARRMLGLVSGFRLKIRSKNPKLHPDAPIVSCYQLSRKRSEIKKKSGAPGGTRTLDLLVRSQTLYPTELRAHKAKFNTLK
jgi:hypothetical protein